MQPTTAATSLPPTQEPSSTPSITLTPTPTTTPIPTATHTPTILPTPLGASLGGRIWIQRLESQVGGYNSDNPLLQLTGSAQLTPLGAGLPGMWVQSRSPDGKKILISVNDTPVMWSSGKFEGPANSDIFSVSLEDGLILNLTDSDTYSRNPDWSPDGKMILYEEYVGEISNIFNVNADGKNPTRLTKDGKSGLPKISPDGKWIAFIRREGDWKHHLYLMDVQGENIRQLTSGNMQEDGWMDNLAWSPDGKYLAFSRALYDAKYAHGPFDGGLYLYSIAADEIIAIDNDLSRLPVWSPDGTKLAYVRGDYCIPCKNTLFIVDMQNNDRFPLKNFEDQSIDRMNWSPDGKLLELSMWYRASSVTDTAYRVDVVNASDGATVTTYNEYRHFLWLPNTLSMVTSPAECPAGVTHLQVGEKAILSPDRPTNPLRAYPGRYASQKAELQQGDVLTLLGRACAPERIYWQVQLPDGTKGWTAEGDGTLQWLIPYSGQALPATPTPTLTPEGAACTNAAEFVTDVTIPDYTKVEAGKKFTKTWKIRNAGTCTWTSKYTWRLIDGAAFDAPGSIPLETKVAPGETVEISVVFKAPTKPGTYKNQWQMHDPAGAPFGTKPFMIFVVP